MQHIHVADAVVIQNNKVLLVQQKKKIAYGLWSFPGGRVEENETTDQAVRREVNEEIGLALDNVKPLKVYELQGPTAKLILHTYTGDVAGKIVLKEDELLAYGWFSQDDLFAMKDKLRNPIILTQIKDALENISYQ